MKRPKYVRIMDMHLDLEEGKLIRKETLALAYEIDMRTVQRDIDDLRAYYAERTALVGEKERQIIYDRKERGYRAA